MDALLRWECGCGDKKEINRDLVTNCRGQKNSAPRRERCVAASRKTTRKQQESCGKTVEVPGS